MKAKEAQTFVEKILTIAKNNTPTSKRMVFSLLRDKGLIEPLFNEIAPRFKSRVSGFTRVIPLYPRRGDASPMALLELIEKKPKAAPKKAKVQKPKSRLDLPAKKTVKEPPKPAATPKPEKAVQEPKRPAPQPPREKAEPKKRGLFKGFGKFFGRKTP